jgi:hypothetical protein
MKLMNWKDDLKNKVKEEGKKKIEEKMIEYLDHHLSDEKKHKVIETLE